MSGYRCACGATYAVGELPEREWVIEGEWLALVDCACGSTISRDLRSAETERPVEHAS